MELRINRVRINRSRPVHCGAVSEGNAIVPGCIGGIRQGELVLRNPTDKIFYEANFVTIKTNYRC